jgi:hypothetical protein
MARAADNLTRVSLEFGGKAPAIVWKDADLDVAVPAIVGALFTRGVLIDLARYKGVARLDPTYVITVEDIEGTLAMQGVEIRAGDAVLFHTGWGQLWMVDNEASGASDPVVARRPMAPKLPQQ